MLGCVAETERNDDTEFSFILTCSISVTVLSQNNHIL